MKRLAIIAAFVAICGCSSDNGGRGCRFTSTDIGPVTEVIYLKTTTLIITPTHRVEVQGIAIVKPGHEVELREWSHPVAPDVSTLYFPQFFGEFLVVGP